ncbi:MAG: ThiF family adenylyltransferase [Steroidobacteraceae bacterium]
MADFEFSSNNLDALALRQSLEDPACGGYAAFEGWVRNLNEGREVRRLEYEAFETLAVREGARIIEEARRKFGVTNARCVHRIGDLPLGEIAVWVGVSAPHRDEAFRACRYIIDEVKHRVPIWKKEHYIDGDSGWVNCERCAADANATASASLGHEDHHGHRHEHRHEHHHRHHHGHHHERVQAPDYSRQMALPEVGADGQQRLQAARVGVIGAGGLGVPVLQYLAGAGIGELIIVDGDRLEASNLHRQTWYAIADCGQMKASLAAARVQALNPEVKVTAHTERLTASSAETLLAGCDLILDCTDNFSTKFLLNDLAHRLGKPVILASVHQYEGQLQLVDPARGTSCLRCVWPEATRDGLVGNCAEAGVLGPIPGVLGSLQALEALKYLLALPGGLRDELVLIDLLTLAVRRIKAKRAPVCAIRCERVAANALAEPSKEEIEYPDLDTALADELVVIDIRDAEEISREPLPLGRLSLTKTLAIPMQEILGGRNLPGDGRYLLICSRGKRSLATCLTLRDRGVKEVYSLRGGAQGLI